VQGGARVNPYVCIDGVERQSREVPAHAEQAQRGAEANSALTVAGQDPTLADSRARPPWVGEGQPAFLKGHKKALRVQSGAVAREFPNSVCQC
jgi:hypothetical protein